jgi:hypothetical protein
VGACVPSGCTYEDLRSNTSSIHPWLVQRFGVSYEFLFANPAAVTVLCGDQSYAYDSTAAAAVAVVALLAAGVLLCTIWSVMYPPPPRERGAPPPPPALLDVARASSLCASGRRIFCVATPPPQKRAAPAGAALDLSALDGMRVLSLSLVVLGHCFFFPLTISGYSNSEGGSPSTFLNLRFAAFQVIPSAEFAVDTFFCLSGALGGLFLTKKVHAALEKRRGGAQFAAPAGDLSERLLSVNEGRSDAASIKSFLGGARGNTPTVAAFAATLVGAWALALTHRYLRLVPSVAALMGGAMYFARLFGNGPAWRLWDGAAQQCSDHGWSNLLFINNFFPGPDDQVFNNQCVGVRLLAPPCVPTLRVCKRFNYPPPPHSTPSILSPRSGRGTSPWTSSSMRWRCRPWWPRFCCPPSRAGCASPSPLWALLARAFGQYWIKV